MKRFLACAILVGGFASGAFAEERPLAVRSDAINVGRYFVGVEPGVDNDQGRKVPIDVEVRFGDESAPAKVYRSPDPSGFDLCAMLRKSEVATTPGTIFLLVRRGQAVARKRIPYDGKGCQGVSRGGGGIASDKSLKEALKGLKPLSLADDATPAPAPTAVAVVSVEPTRTAVVPVVPVIPDSVVASASTPTSTPRSAPPAPTAREPERTPDRPVATFTPTATATPGSPSEARTPAAPLPTATPEAAPTHAPSPFPTESARPTPGAEPLTAEQRRLTSSNFQKLEVFLETDDKLKTEDYHFVLTFKEPVNITGIEDAVFKEASAQVRRREIFFDSGMANTIDPPDDPASTQTVEFTVPRSLAVATPGVNQLVTLRIFIGPDALFKCSANVKRKPKK